MAPNDATPPRAATDAPSSAGAGAPSSRNVQPEALAAVIEQRDRIVARIMALTGCDRGEAEDVLQEVTLRVLDGGITADVADWIHYLAAAGRNTHRDTQRRERTAARHAAALPWLTGTVLPDDVAEAVLARMDLEEALAALDALPPLAARVFLMREYAQMKPRDICATLGLTRKQEQYRYDQARRNLARIQEQRRAEQAAILMLLLLRPVRDGGGAGALSSPLVKAGIAASPVGAVVAIAAALAVVVRFTGLPLPHVTGTTDQLVLTAPAVDRTDAADLAASRKPRTSTSGPAAARDAVPPGVARGPDTARHPVYVEACVGGLVCGRTSPEETPPGAVWAGDRYTFLRVGPLQPQANQFVTRTCDDIPSTPAMTCEEGEGPYLIEGDGEERPPPVVKHSPPAPETSGAHPGGIPA